MPDFGLTIDFFSSINCVVKYYRCIGEFIPDIPENIKLFVFHYQENSPGNRKVIKYLRNKKPNVPFILTSTHRDENLTLWALRSRIWDIVKLPHELPLLKESIKKILNKDELDSKYDSSNFSNQYSKTGLAREFIDANFGLKIKVENLADMSHMSPTTFLRYFKKENGITVREYIKRVRILNARELLQTTRFSIKEIALSSGFSDISLFNRIFKKIVGQTPSEYRKNYCSIW